MTLTSHEQLLLAARIASRAHANQKRKDGTPYIAHPMRVMVRVADEGDLVMTTALLHDVVEDSDITLAELKSLGFDVAIINAVDHLTKREGEAYTDFIDRCKKNQLATLVKKADIADNIEDQSALEPEEAAFFKKRYEKALEKLG